MKRRFIDLNDSEGKRAMLLDVNAVSMAVKLDDVKLIRVVVDGADQTLSFGSKEIRDLSFDYLCDMMEKK